MHRFAATLPDFERYALGDQLRRASRSVPANIAEGFARRQSVKDFRHFLAIAMGSSNEMTVHLDIAREVGYDRDDACLGFRAEYDIIGSQLFRLSQKWQTFQLLPPTSYVIPPGDQR